jgi:hypothetical protein
MDLSASITLIIGAVGTFQRSADTVHLFGALGVALKWFSAVRGSEHPICARLGNHFYACAYILQQNRCKSVWTAVQSKGANI